MDAELRALLDDLNSTVSGVDDPATRSELMALLARVQRHLAGEDEDEGLVHRLEEAAARLEGEHPGVGGALRTVVHGLGAAGI